MESSAFILTSSAYLTLSLRLYSVTAITEEIANVNNARSNKALILLRNKLGWKENSHSKSNSSLGTKIQSQWALFPLCEALCGSDLWFISD